MNLSENEKTTVQAASASRMNMRREARNQLVFLSAQFLLGMGGRQAPRALPRLRHRNRPFRTRIRALGTPPHSQSSGSVMTTNTDRARSAR